MLVRFSVSLLVLASVAAAAVFALLEAGEAATLGWTLIGALMATSMARPFRGAGVLATALGTVLFFGVQLYRSLSTAGSALELRQLAPGLEGALLLVGVGLLAEIIARRLQRVGDQMDQNAAAIKELTLRDGLTGTLKSVYADKLLAEEIERARRYHRNVSVVLLCPDDWPATVRERGREKAIEALKEVGQVVMKGLRSMDVVSHREESRFLVILPETPAPGAQLVAERLCEAVAAETGLRFRSGVAEFPDDAVSKDELIGEAEAALEFAQSARMTVASRSLLT